MNESVIFVIILLKTTNAIGELKCENYDFKEIEVVEVSTNTGFVRKWTEISTSVFKFVWRFFSSRASLLLSNLIPSIEK